MAPFIQRDTHHSSVLTLWLVFALVIPVSCVAMRSELKGAGICYNLSFSKTSVVAGTHPMFVTVAELNGDGNRDLIVINSGDYPEPGGVLILLGNGNGTFQAPVNYSVGSAPTSVALGDFNADGRVDLAVANSGSDNVSVLLGKGNGAFESAVNYGVGSGPRSIAAGDFNRDGRPDLAIANSFTDKVSVLIGNGDGTFKPAAGYDSWNNTKFIAVGDFNGDGNTDLAAVNSGFGSETVAILLGDGMGGFQLSAIPSFEMAPTSVLVADFNGDGKADLAVTNGSNHLSVRLGRGDGSFEPSINYPVGSQPAFAMAGDFNGDGKTDVAVANYDSATVSILIGNGNGTFQSSLDIVVGSGPNSVAVGDFNGDGRPDFATTNNYTQDISILTNLCLSCSSISVFPQTLPDGMMGTPYQQTITASGGGSPYTFAIAEGAVPSGLTLSSSGLLSGTPFSPGNVAFSIAATDVAGCIGRRSYTLDLKALPGYAPPSFEIPPRFRVGQNPRAIVRADLNGDGKEDLAVGNYYSNDLSILLGKGDGTFQNAVTYKVGSRPISIVVGDFDRDGKWDIAVANNDAASVSILLGKGDGTFQAAVDYPSGPFARSVAKGDFNGDGKTDLVLAETFYNGNDGAISVLLGNGDGSFRPPVYYPAGFGPYTVDVGDLNGDGKTDLVVPNLNSGKLAILLGSGDGTFRAPVYIDTGGSPTFAALGDFNGDGRVDAAVVSDFDSRILVLLGNGDGTLRPPTRYDVGSTPYSLAVGDVNGDGRTDLVVATGDATILLGNGDGTFQKPFKYDAGLGSMFFALGDFNGDHIIDLAGTNNGSGTVTLLLGKGNGRFVTPFIYPTGRSPSFISGGDFDGDGILDLAVVNAESNDVSVLLGNGDGSFKGQTRYAVGSGPTSTAVGDFNGDGKIDLAVTNYNSASISVLLGMGDGSFKPAVNYAVGDSPLSIVTSDFNGDRNADLAVANYFSNTISILLGNGDGTFRSTANLEMGGQNPRSIVAGDFNGDGKVDLAVANYGINGAQVLSIMLGEGNGQFKPSVNYYGGHSPISVAAGDFNGDGTPDLAVANNNSASISVYLGLGDGSFRFPPTNYTVDEFPDFVLVGDFNGDGRDDLVVTGESLTILLGSGGGVFQDPLRFDLRTYFVLPGDFNRDGKLDLAKVSSGVTILLNNCSSCPAIRLFPKTLPSGQVRTTFTQTFTANGGTWPYRFTVTGGSIPPGLLLSTSGMLSGVPLVSGQYAFTLTATDVNGSTRSELYRVSVASLEGQVSADLPVSSGGSRTLSTVGSNGFVHAGYATVEVDSGLPPYGTAVFTVIQNGIVVSEAGVPASPPTTAARIFVDSHIDTGTSTGFAIVNRGTNIAHIIFELRDYSRAVLATGHTTLLPNQHRALYLHELNQIAPDFVISDIVFSLFGTLDITSDEPLSVLGLRLTYNARTETLLTSTPIVDLTKSFSPAPLFFPQFADGNGFKTRVVLLNPSNTFESGTIRFLDDKGQPSPVYLTSTSGPPSADFGYGIPPKEFLWAQTDGSPDIIKSGSIQIIPSPGSNAPEGALVMDYTVNGMLVTQTGVPAATPTTHARIYVDRSSGHNTGLAIAAPTQDPLQVIIKAYESDGSTLAGSATLEIMGNGHDAKFANEIIPTIPEGFTGVLDISSASPFVALTLRSLTNARGDFLLTTFPIADANQSAPNPLIFPQIADGGGYQTQFILISTGSGASTTLSFFGDDGAPLAVGKRGR